MSATKAIAVTNLEIIFDSCGIVGENFPHNFLRYGCVLSKSFLNFVEGD